MRINDQVKLELEVKHKLKDFKLGGQQQETPTTKECTNRSSTPEFTLCERRYIQYLF